MYIGSWSCVALLQAIACSLLMPRYIHIHVFVCVYIFIYTYIYIHIYIYIGPWSYVALLEASWPLCIPSLCSGIYICMCVCVYVYIYIGPWSCVALLKAIVYSLRMLRYIYMYIYASTTTPPTVRHDVCT